MPHRFVGTYEYTNALKAWDYLVTISSTEDLKAYDQLLEERQEFSYFNGTNLAAGKRLSMRESVRSRSGADKFQKKFGKQGLAWMMALAKIELSATESLYGKSELPFQTVPVTRFDGKEYMSVLADDAAAHLRSLSQEAKFKEVVNPGRRVDTWTLAYLRRLKLIRDMLTTLNQFGDNTVRAKVKGYGRQLGKYEEKLLTTLLVQTQATSTTSTTKNTSKGKSSTRLSIGPGAIENCENLIHARYPTGSSGGGSSSGGSKN